MWTAFNRKSIKEMVALTRELENELKADGHDIVHNTQLIKCKRKVRKNIARANAPTDSVVYYGDGGERTREFFTVEYDDGGKEALRDLLWAKFAHHIYSDYDCTGQRYTSDILVGHIGKNRYRVCIVEYLDI